MIDPNDLKNTAVNPRDLNNRDIAEEDEEIHPGEPGEHAERLDVERPVKERGGTPSGDRPFDVNVPASET